MNGGNGITNGGTGERRRTDNIGAQISSAADRARFAGHNYGGTASR